MSLTKAEKSRVNRENASRSTGPRTDAGKRSSSMNSLKHGLCIRKLALPDEDAALLQEKLAWWNGYYRPDTPGECELIEMAVTASLQRARSHRFLTAALTDQVRTAAKRWDEAREDEVLRLARLLVADPAAAVPALRRTGHGCRWLIGRWGRLAERLDAAGDDGWQPRDCLEAIRLQGHYADAEHLSGSSEASMTRYCFETLFPDHAVGGYGGGPVDIRDILRSPGWGKPKPEGADPKVAAARAEAWEWLRGTIARHLDELKLREPIVRELFDDPARASSGERALLLEGATGSNWQRYERMHELAFHRAYNALLKGRERSEETGLPPGAPNEANEAETEEPSTEEEVISVAEPAPKMPSGGEVGGKPKTFAGALAPNEAKRPGFLVTTPRHELSNVEENGENGPAGPEATAASGTVADAKGVLPAYEE
jgi:hypothetical protein